MLYYREIVEWILLKALNEFHHIEILDKKSHDNITNVELTLENSVTYKRNPY